MTYLGENDDTWIRTRDLPAVGTKYHYTKHVTPRLLEVLCNDLGLHLPDVKCDLHLPDVTPPGR